jgi:D-serine dehydratase
MKSDEKTLLEKVLGKNPVYRENHEKKAAAEALKNAESRYSLGFNAILDAENRLKRFTPFIKKMFPDAADGIIESELKPAFSFGRKVLGLSDNFFIKCDSRLSVAGSVKARGGIYEILKHAEKLALGNSPVTAGSDYSVFASPEIRKMLSGYHIAVGSTGNLGMSIGIISAALGFRVTIHMSHDAKEWKKNRLRSLGVNVIEHKGLYAEAVEAGRVQCSKDPLSYFVDDENSKELFLGYSTAALRIEKQLKTLGVPVNKDNPLFVYLPCGVGGAPGGISFGLKHIYGDSVKCYFAEPVNAPTVMLGLMEKRKINFKDYGFIMETDADGLAVDSPSELVLDICHSLIDGTFTVHDETMDRDLHDLKVFEGEKIEVSAAASLHGPLLTGNKDKKGTHIAWLTGGLFVPEEEYIKMYEKGRPA